MTIHLLEETRVELNVAVFALGCLILIVGISRDLLNAKVPASAITVAMLVGIILGPHVLDLIKTDKIGDSEILVQEVSRLVIAIQLMAIGLNIPFHYLTKAWLTQGVLLTLVVGLMWITSGAIIYGFFRTVNNSLKFSFWESLLLGACVAPTDPVLASAVSTSALAISQVPARLRHTITAESGLNDGTGFPFVMLCLRFVRQGNDSAGKVIGDWIVEDILWEILLAFCIAIAAGFVVGKLLLWAEPAKLHDQQLLVALTLALAFTFVGGAQLLGINGLILVVVGGVVYAKVVEGDKRGSETQLQETVDLIFSTLVFAIFGLIIPFDRWHLIGWWRGLLLCLALAIFRRVPWILILKPIFREQIHSIPDALFVGWFGPIGVGAIFYALFAAEYLDNDDRGWVVISMIVFSQVIIFGVTDTFFTRLYARTNPHYIRRRKRKQKVIERAETQIQHIQEHVVHTLESMPASPQLGPNDSPAWGDIPEFELGQEFPGSPSSLDLRIARGEAVENDMANGTELRSFSSDRSLGSSRAETRSPHQVSFNLDTDADYENGNRDGTNGSDTGDNTILGTSRRLLGRALAQSHAGFRRDASLEEGNENSPPKSRSEMRVSDLVASDSETRAQRRLSLPTSGSEQRKLSRSSYI